MQRSSKIPLQSVTGLPVLVPCELGQEDGFVMATPVRIVTAKLIVDAVKNRNRKAPLGLTAADWKIVHGFKLLLRAWELKDLKAAKSGAELLVGTPAAGLFPPANIPDDLKPGDLEDFRRGVVQALSYNAIQDARLMADLMTATLKGANPVIWKPGDIFDNHKKRETAQRGMWCDDMMRAVTYLMLFDGVRICLRCHVLFEGKPHLDYHTVQCRESHRVARWRERKKAEAEQKRDRRRK